MRFTLTILLLYPLLLFAQQYNFRNWSLEEGLPQSQVNTIIQDHKGQLWIGTRGGLSRFDGTAFFTFTKRDGLTGANIYTLFEDSKKNIWVGTDMGLSVFNGTSFITYTSNSGAALTGIRAITEDKLGKIILASDSGVFTFEDGSYRKLDDLPDQAYTSLLVSSNGALWAGSATQGLYRIDDNGLTHYHTGNSTLTSDNISCLIEKNKGTIWIGTLNGLLQHQLKKITPLKLPLAATPSVIQSFTKDLYGNIWIGLQSKGLLRYDGKRFNLVSTENGLLTNSILCLQADLEGNIWIGTNGHGMQQYRSPWFIHYPNGEAAKDSRIAALIKDEGQRLWLATENGQLAYFKNDHLQWLSDPKWPDDLTLYTLQAINTKTILACTNKGVWRIGGSFSKIYGKSTGLPTDDIYYCLSDTAGNLWFATADGVAIKSRHNLIRPQVNESTPLGKAYFVHIDRDNQIWIGAENGVFYFVDGKLEPHPALAGFDFREVTAITEAKDGTLFFGGFNYGLIAFNNNWHSPRLITKKDGLPNEGITGLYVDRSDNLWIGTSRSVAKMPLNLLSPKDQLTIYTYNSKDGFTGLEVGHNAIMQTADGNLWFGTSKGLTQFMPDKERHNKVQPFCQLNSIKLFMQDTDWPKMGYKTDSTTGLPVNLRLAHHQNHISFNYKGICLSDPEQIRYRYRLKGYQEQWSEPTEQSFASFDGLAPGTYTFQLMAQNNDGYWTSNPLNYTFSITPPIWKREWFIAVLLLVVGSTAVSVARLREKSLVKMNAVLELKVKHRTKQLEEKNFEKEILLKEIHHRVKNNLQIVISMLNLQARQLKDDFTLDVMRALRNRVRSMALLHERLYQHQDLSSIDLDDYIRGICESLYASYGTSTKQIALELHVPNIKVDIDSAITLGLIVNELISNTLKYAFQGSTGILRIELRHQYNQSYILSVCDNGKGLPFDFETRKENSFGVQLISSLAKKLNGSVTFSSNHGTSSILYFDLSS
ncbi:two-component regulator propeller domain-containing protein [Pontibacter sp. SGAir0037]|uniref:two-component regulator propeller domain-containing protein n=1 Tax=Pontibacter sp. SGAir0037 TaxID=2571030 RepID=UPI0010CCEDF4|nr:two-component regulator propeller domain-containing protein [Pontibacter sp. SGAir0037]QCR23486.1 hypothetical protein C1N53_14815 [Pontibacter sp. SGAir0037]